MQPDGGLPRARPALDDEGAVGLGGDQAILVRLDRGDDVPHAALATALELLEQEVGDGRALHAGAVERLVGDVDDATALGAIAAPLRDPLRIGRRGGVERTRGRRLPVDDEHLVLVVVHPAAADVERPEASVERQAPEAEAALGVLERPDAPLRPRLHRDRGELGGHRVAGALERRAHRVEARVGVVDVGLFLGELGMRHGFLTVPT